MLYALTKIAWFLAEPSNLLTLAAGGGIVLVLIRRAAKLARALLLFSVAGTVTLGLGPVPSLLMSSLEDRFPPFVDDGKPIAGAIVLGGSIEPDIAFSRNALSVNETAERIIAMADIARRYPQARVVFTGGSAELFGAKISEADMVEKFERDFGLAPGRIMYERASRNTAENARLTRGMVMPKPGERWLLVTSAWHMPRSVASFRREGFQVIAYPVDYRSLANGELTWTVSIARGLGRSGQAIREWIGLVGYRLAGWSDRVLPSP